MHMGRTFMPSAKSQATPARAEVSLRAAVHDSARPVQRQANPGNLLARVPIMPPAPSVQSQAAAGTRDTASALPHLARIQASFGAHDVSQVQAHQGRAARASARALAAEAYTMGEHAVFTQAPSLQTAAHEAAHVVQQRSGRISAGLGSEHSEHERHADAVAEKVLRGESSQSLLDTYAPAAGAAAPGVQRQAAVQRKVLLKTTVMQKAKKEGKWKVLNASEHGAEGDGDRNVSAMINHAGRKYYFENEGEMRRYANKQTDFLGYVATRDHKAWIRFEPRKLHVLGETHDNLTLGHIVTAVGTNRYRYEPYTAAPDDLKGDDQLNALLKARGDAIIWDKGGRPDNAPHFAETFYSKVAAALNYLWASGDELRFDDATAATYLHMSLVHSSKAHKSKELRKFYNRHHVLIDDVIDDLAHLKTISQTKLWSVAANRLLLWEYRRLVNESSTAQAAATLQTITRRMRTRFNQHWKKTANYSNEQAPAEKARELSMYQYVHFAKDAGNLLFGMGENHRKSLSAVLQNDGIWNKHMDAFLKEQKELYPQL